MQTTLLGLAIAFILALIAALAGPSFIDWNSYRGEFEVQATRIVGAPVRVGGTMDVRILPVPSLVLHEIEIGPPSGEPRLRAATLDIKLGLGALLRGELRAAELRIVAPEVTVGIDSSGRIEAPTLAGLDNPDRFAIERLNVIDGRAVLADATSGNELVLDKLAFNGEVRSLAGPFKGEGGFITNGHLYRYRLSSGRIGEDGGMKLRLSVDLPDHPLSAEIDGVLALDRGDARFDGGLTVRRPITASGEPWTVITRVKATPTSVLFEQADLQYGPDDRATKLVGSAELTFGAAPAFRGALLARQVNLDRMADPTEQERKLPVAMISKIAETFGQSTLPIPVQLSLSVDALTLAGATLHTVSADIASDGDTWNLDNVDVHGPGLTQLVLSGRLKLAPAAEFTGSVSIDSGQPNVLAAWLHGHPESAPGRASPLQLSGDITASSDLLAIEHLQAEIDRKKLTGRASYLFAADNAPARLDLAVEAEDLDVDYVLELANTVLGGMTTERPGELALALNVGRATVAGVELKGAKLKLKLNKNALAIEQLSLADVGTTKLDMSGGLALAPSAGGQLRIRLDTQNVDAIVTLARRFLPQAAEPIRQFAARYVPASVSANIDVAGAATPSPAKSRMSIHLDGLASGMRVNVVASTTGDLAAIAAGDFSTLAVADIRSEGLIEADDGRVLAALLNVDRLFAVERRKGRIKFEANGSVAADVAVKGRFDSEGIDVSAGGKLRWSDNNPVGTLDLSVVSATGGILRRPGGDTVPLKVQTRLSIAGPKLAFENLTGKIAGSDIRGYLDVVLDRPLHVEGRLKAEAIDAAALVASVAGMPSPGMARATSERWSAEPFSASVLGDDVTGQVTVEAARASFTPRLAVSDLRTVARFTGADITFEDVKGRVGDGPFVAQASFRKGPDGLATQLSFDLKMANISAVLTGDGRPPVAGRLSLHVDGEGVGRSPAALVGSLTGSGTLSLDGGQIAGLDPRAFDAAINAVDRGLPINTARISDVVSAGLDGGWLNLPSIGGAITISSGQMRAGSMIAPAQDADVTVSGSLDLSDGLLDMRVKLLGAPKADAPNNRRPEMVVFVKGPLTGPKRTLDVTSLTNWLTMRLVERETRRLEAIEAVGRIPSPAPPAESPSPSPPAASPPDAKPTGEPPPSAGVPPGEKAPNLQPPAAIEPSPGSGQRPTTLPLGNVNGSVLTKPE